MPDRDFARDLVRLIDRFAHQVATIVARDAKRVLDRSMRSPSRRLYEAPEPSDPADALAVRYKLTDRETAILRLSLEGVPRRELAARRGVRQSTIKTHTRALIRKLGYRTLADAVIALQRDLRRDH